MTRILANALLCLLVCGCGMQGEDTSDGAASMKAGVEAADLAGKWKVLPSGTLTAEDVRDMTYEFTATEITMTLPAMSITGGSQLSMSGTYTIDDSKKPRTIIYRITKGADDVTVEKPISKFGNEVIIGSGDDKVVLQRIGN